MAKYCDSDTGQQGEAWIDLVRRKFGNKTSIYPGSKITTMDSISLLMAFSLQYNATQRTMSSLIKIIELHMPADSATPKHLRSFYQLKKVFDLGTEGTITKHEVCSYCGYLFQGPITICPMCTKLRTLTKDSYFITLDVKSQLEEFFKDPAFSKAICSSTNKRSEDGVIRDVFDGEIYCKRYSRPTVDDKSSLFLTVTWHFDGVKVSKSSKQSIWPLHGVINELPPNMRFCKDRILLFGLWFGDSKPQMPSFMQPLTPVLNDLYESGINVCGHVVKIKLHVGTMDLLAMCLAKNMTQFNGKYGCGICEVRSTRKSKGKGSVSVYPWTSTKSSLRTSENMMLHAKEAMDIRDEVKGIKGYTMLSMIADFNPATDVVVDYLHGVCGGVMKSLVRIWLNDKAKACYIGDKMDTLDARMNKIRPTDCITRTPRPIGDNFADMKASEFRALLLYYGCAVLKGILPQEYYVHFALFSTAVYMLMREEIRSADLEMAEANLNKFYYLFTPLYGEENCTMNVHNTCRHLVDCVRKSGPLWAFGCFPFESNCGQMAKFVRGNRYCGMQVVTNYKLLQRIRTLGSSTNNPDVKKAIQNITGEKTTDFQKRVGLKRLRQESEEAVRVAEYLGYEVQCLRRFSKLERKLDTIYSTDYTRLKKRIAHVVEFKHGNDSKIGRINFFLEVNSRLHLAVLDEATILSNNAHREGDETLWDTAGIPSSAGSYAKKVRFERSSNI